MQKIRNEIRDEKIGSFHDSKERITELKNSLDWAKRTLAGTKAALASQKKVLTQAKRDRKK